MRRDAPEHGGVSGDQLLADGFLRLGHRRILVGFDREGVLVASSDPGFW